MLYEVIMHLFVLSWVVAMIMGLVMVVIKSLKCSHEENQKYLNKEDNQNGSQS